MSLVLLLLIATISTKHSESTTGRAGVVKQSIFPFPSKLYPLDEGRKLQAVVFPMKPMIRLKKNQWDGGDVKAPH
jgi:hypothetical protein